MSVRLHHINAGLLHAPPNPEAACHCWIIETDGGLVLVDSGIGLEDGRDPERRIGREAIEMAGYTFDPRNTAAKQIERIGLSPADVRHIVLTHADPDHAGGLADFPDATVHMTGEEHDALHGGNPRYSHAQFGHGPTIRLYRDDDARWQGLAARTIRISHVPGLLFVPLFGHTAGHAGVAVEIDGSWHLHTGDAYMVRDELTDHDHPVGQFAEMIAVDNLRRLESLDRLRELEASGTVRMNGYHDFTEFETSPAVVR
ncbi:MAG: MBL fold metallo-hydrolase [Planctomycetota bacterium]